MINQYAVNDKLKIKEREITVYAVVSARDSDSITVEPSNGSPGQPVIITDQLIKDHNLLIERLPDKESGPWPEDLYKDQPKEGDK